jgi:hypothetical protein
VRLAARGVEHDNRELDEREHGGGDIDLASIEHLDTSGPLIEQWEYRTMGPCRLLEGRELTLHDVFGLGDPACSCVIPASESLDALLPNPQSL